MSIFRKILKHSLPLLLRPTGVTQVVTRTDHGTFAFLADDKFIGWKMAVNGTRDPAITRLVEALVKPGDLVIDAGANLGWYSVVLARCVGDAGTVLAFEPDTRAFELLTANLRRNGVEARVRAFNFALSSSDAGLTLELSGNNFGDNRIRVAAAAAASDRYGESQREVREVKAARLDPVVEAAGAASRPVRFIKMDCQGFEVEILRGAPATLARTEALLLEYWPYGLERCGASLDALIAALGGNFSRYTAIPESGELSYRPFAAFADDARRVRTQMDYLFLRQ